MSDFALVLFVAFLALILGVKLGFMLSQASIRRVFLMRYGIKITNDVFKGYKRD